MVMSGGGKGLTYGGGRSTLGSNISALAGSNHVELCVPSYLRRMCVRTRLKKLSGTRRRGQVKSSIVTEILIGIG